MEERRKSPRARFDGEVRIRMGRGGSEALVRDLSASGVRCVTDTKLAAMTHVQLVLLLPALDRRPGAVREVVASGAVVRSVPIADATPAGSKFDTAIFFTDIDDSDRTLVQELVGTRLGSEAPRA